MDFFKGIGIFLSFTLCAAFSHGSGVELDPTKLVPQGQVVAMKKDETHVRTPKGTVVEIEFHSNGDLEEISGHSAGNGDVLSPGTGLLTLDDAIAVVKKLGKAPTGEWTLEHSMVFGWVYELHFFENGQEMEALVSAKDGRIIQQKADD